MANRQTVQCKAPEGLQKNEPINKESIHNFGNPVFTYKADLPVELSPPVQCTPEEVAAGYSSEPVNIMYKTSSQEYGSRPPTLMSAPLVFHARSQRFSDRLGKCGMPRNRGMNCSLDKSRVPLK